MENNYFSSDTGQDKTEWQSVWRINSSVLPLDKVNMNDNQYKGLFTKCEVKMA